MPENNYEIMIREYMNCDSNKDFAIITNVNDKFLDELEVKLHYKNDKRIKFVGTVYNQELLMKIRENAWGYFHGHEVGGTNPSLLEALGSTELNLLLDVGFNREVAEEAAFYWTKEHGNLAKLISWANEPWTKAWVGDAKKVLIPQNYGEEKEWKEHFDYLLPFFKDDRYIKVDGKPLFVMYRPEIVGCLNQMLDYWNKLAKGSGFENGFYFAYQNIDFDLKKDKDDSRFNMNIEFEPLYAYHDMFANQHKYLKAIRRNIDN